ncbi:MAG: hypothetical protein Q8O62_10000 [Aequorivita sp.]|nr:hypothetical protein [Aequorivita sp.]
MAGKTSVQFGTSVTADFQEGTWTFQMPKDFTMTAGNFAILPLSEFRTNSIQPRILDTECGTIDLKRISAIGSISPKRNGFEFLIWNKKNTSTRLFCTEKGEERDLIEIRNQVVEAWKKHRNQ